MCPACLLTIGGGLLLARRLGVNDVLTIGIVTIIVSYFIEKLLRKINKGKAHFSYQKVIIPILILLISIFMVKYLI